MSRGESDLVSTPGRRQGAAAAPPELPGWVLRLSPRLGHYHPLYVLGRRDVM